MAHSEIAYSPVTAQPLKVGLDLDGTVCDFLGTFAQVVATNRGQAVDDLTLTPANYACDEWGMGDQYHTHFDRGVQEHRMFSALSPYPQSVETVRRLADEGVADFHIITARNTRNAAARAIIREDTALWVRNVGLSHVSLRYLSDKLHAGDLDVWIDDNPSHVARLYEAGKTVIVYDQSYNRDVGATYRVTDYRQIETILREEYELKNRSA